MSVVLVSSASGFAGTQAVKQFAGKGHSFMARPGAPRLGPGAQLRDYMDVDEAGQVGAINICSGWHVSIRPFAESIANRYGRRDLLEFGTHQPDPRDPSAVVGVPNYVVEGSKRDARS